ncbi:MAG: methyltransferase [Gemmatimonadales bacterium]
MSCGCEAADRHFTTGRAEQELAAYRRRGPRGTARRMLRLLEDAGVRAETLLDVGGGIGVLQHELLARGVRRAVQVEGAGAYLRVAREESARRGQAERVSVLEGDFVALAPTIPPADLVTLDRVICCYAGLEALVRASAERAGRWWAASFPRDRWYVRLLTSLENRLRARARDPFRTFVHPVARIHELLGHSGLRPVRVRRGPVWEVALFARDGSPARRMAS